MMAKNQKATTSTELLNVLFDMQTSLLLGRGGRWMTATEFEKDPPRSPTDLVPRPTPDNPAIPDPDPGPTYKCLSGFVHSCNGQVCVRVIQPNGQPIPCK